MPIDFQNEISENPFRKNAYDFYHVNMKTIPFHLYKIMIENNLDNYYTQMFSHANLRCKFCDIPATKFDSINYFFIMRI